MSQSLSALMHLVQNPALLDEFETSETTLEACLLRHRPDLICAAAELLSDQWPKPNVETRNINLISALARETDICFVLLDSTSNDLLGYCRLSRGPTMKNGLTAILFDFVIKQSRRKNGLGSKLLAFVEEVARRNDVTRILLKTRHAGGFYRKLGYRRSKRDRHGMTALKANADRLTEKQVRNLENVFAERAKQIGQFRTSNEEYYHKRLRQMGLPILRCEGDFERLMDLQLRGIWKDESTKLPRYMRSMKMSGGMLNLPFIEQRAPNCGYAAVAMLEEFVRLSRRLNCRPTLVDHNEADDLDLQISNRVASFVRFASLRNRDSIHSDICSFINAIEDAEYGGDGLDCGDFALSLLPYIQFSHIFSKTFDLYPLQPTDNTKYSDPLPDIGGVSFNPRMHVCARIGQILSAFFDVQARGQNSDSFLPLNETHSERVALQMLREAKEGNLSRVGEALNIHQMADSIRRHFVTSDSGRDFGTWQMIPQNCCVESLSEYADQMLRTVEEAKIPAKDGIGNEGTGNFVPVSVLLVPYHRGRNGAPELPQFTPATELDDGKEEEGLQEDDEGIIWAGNVSPHWMVVCGAFTVQPCAPMNIVWDHKIDTLQGELYKAYDFESQTDVALKVAFRHCIERGMTMKRTPCKENFVRECNMMAYVKLQPDCPDGFVEVFAYFEDDVAYHSVTEWCNGGDLLEYVNHQNVALARATFQTFEQIPPGMDTPKITQYMLACQHIFRQHVQAIGWLHSVGIAHRDLSVENSLTIVNPNSGYPVIRITDFGQAMAARRVPTTDGEWEWDFTCNEKVGKKSYLAPEVFYKKKYDARSSDIWSLGVILLTLLTATYIYDEKNCREVFADICSNGVARILGHHYHILSMIPAPALDLLDMIFRLEENRIDMEHLWTHPWVNLHGSAPATDMSRIPYDDRDTDSYARHFRVEGRKVHGVEIHPWLIFRTSSGRKCGAVVSEQIRGILELCDWREENTDASTPEAIADCDARILICGNYLRDIFVEVGSRVEELQRLTQQIDRRMPAFGECHHEINELQMLNALVEQFLSREDNAERRLIGVESRSFSQITFQMEDLVASNNAVSQVEVRIPVPKRRVLAVDAEDDMKERGFSLDQPATEERTGNDAGYAIQDQTHTSERGMEIKYTSFHNQMIRIDIGDVMPCANLIHGPNFNKVEMNQKEMEILQGRCTTDILSFIFGENVCG